MTVILILEIVAFSLLGLLHPNCAPPPSHRSTADPSSDINNIWKKTAKKSQLGKKKSAKVTSHISQYCNCR
jgi:hypothetical protein